MTDEVNHEVVRRWHEGQSERAIARDLKLGRSRVRRILTEHQQSRSGEIQAGPLPSPPQPRPSKLDEYEAAMRELLTRYPHITAVRMLEELKIRGFQGGYSTVRDRMKLLRPQPTRPLVQRFETAPGLQAQMDYAEYDLDFTQEGRRRVYLFSYVLAYSRRQYLGFTESQDFTTTIRHHVRAFEYLGGVAASCLYDNMKVVVSRYEADQPVYNTRFLAFATHYGFRPVACRPRRPETKGKVERPFYYVETNLLNGRSFHSLEQLNEFTRRWLAEVADVRLHKTTGHRPIDLHAQEQPHLIALPANSYDVAEVVYRSIDCEGFLTYRQNQYSVPWRYVGYVLPVRVTDAELIVYGLNIEEIARHRLLSRDCARQRQVCPGHRPADDTQQEHELLRQSFVELGEIGGRFFQKLLEANRQGWAQARKILALRAHYHPHDLVAALERAARYGAFSHQAIERILHVHAQPKTTLETLADEEQGRLSDLLKDTSVHPRKSSDYQQLLFPEDCDAPPHEENRDERSIHEKDSSSDSPGSDPGTLPDADDSPDGGPAG